MDTLRALIAEWPEVAGDVAHDLRLVLVEASSLTETQRWGVALSVAYALRCTTLIRVLRAECERAGEGGVVRDAQAAALSMATNNVYYRFRHFVGKPSYRTKPARLRNIRVGKPIVGRRDLELFELALSALNACEVCTQHHEHVVREAGLTEEQVNDAMRITATLHAASVALAIVEADRA